MKRPERLQALITQNGNVYEAGLGANWSKIAEYWADPAAYPEVIDAFLSYNATEQRHTSGTSHPDRYDPATRAEEFALLSRPGQRDIQASLLYDYRTKVVQLAATAASITAVASRRSTILPFSGQHPLR